jgi:excisionase family DNA binding protein
MINKALNEEGNNAVCPSCIVQDCNVGKMPYSVFALLPCLEKKRRISPKLILKRVKALGAKVLFAHSHQPATADCEGILVSFCTGDYFRCLSPLWRRIFYNKNILKRRKSMSKMTDIRFRLQIAGGNMRMIKRDVFEYFKKEPDVMQVKDVVCLLHCSKNTVYKLIHEGRLDTVRIGRSILIPKTALVEMMVNERYYQIIFPYNPDSLWTMKERSRIIASNKKSVKKEA